MTFRVREALVVFAIFTTGITFGQKPPVKKASSKQLHVTSVKLTVDPIDQHYKGPCPVMVLFNGSITSNGKGAVRYTWENSTGTHYAQYALNFGSPGTINVRQLHWRVSQNFSGWAVLKPLPPHNYISSTKAFFSINCTGKVK
jgi:hypothetical protein